MPSNGSETIPTPIAPTMPPKVFSAVIRPTVPAARDGSDRTMRIASGNDAPDSVAGANMSRAHMASSPPRDAQVSAGRYMTTATDTPVRI